MSETCFECNTAPTTPMVTTPQAGFAEPENITRALPLTPCEVNLQPEAPLACHDGYRWHLTQSSHTTPTRCDEGIIDTPCADKWAYPGLLVEMPPYGYIKVISVEGNLLTYQNLDVASGTLIPALTPLRPIPMVPMEHLVEVSANDEPVGNNEEIWFPVLVKQPGCTGEAGYGSGFTYRMGFKKTLCGIPIDNRTAGAANEVIARDVSGGCLKKIPAAGGGIANPILAQLPGGEIAWKSDVPAWVPKDYQFIIDKSLGSATIWNNTQTLPGYPSPNPGAGKVAAIFQLYASSSPNAICNVSADAGNGFQPLITAPKETGIYGYAVLHLYSANAGEVTFRVQQQGAGTVLGRVWFMGYLVNG